ncbi:MULTISPECIES: helix-turn-helix domain-containing protein [unclassified Mesorhizobium]|uniref:helix-turn-helix domain-containing protein n=1 Tax=unclassified Mesorhizobium TaxID=325217 RepID=UPI000FCA352B|nr:MULTISPECIES: helix-turn-helix domain-containing protein [unclassified Mesorhizobium]RUW00441.1 PucR family transcriptional regulator [Mesorhizobium sp. M1A.F.Ca.IN.020.04.1.1]RUW15804.1 PucR family transcriptional regulator [Mesorhizobium sp. M1A.F.Ca.IN.020.03.1.1]RWF70569.1 MAG: PucR family transcriptional regulator [Mesorhizobium sp.]RWG11328.1 MAG: PucR family transcriptional regulator [Mesorhizobium sp.]RWG28669.1 MAG: PucR family transcriptional regulator [Mesorhizobium sp.]
MDHESQILSLRDAASLINSGGDLQSVLRDLVLAACRHAKWTLGSIMSIDAPHGHAHVIVRHDPTLIQRTLPDRWELATSPSIVALNRNEPVYIRDARVSEEFPGYRREAFERDYRSVLVMPMNCVDEDGRPMVLTVVSREITEVSAEDIAFIGMIVHLGEIAVEKQHRLRQEKQAGERLQRALVAHTSLLQQALSEGSVAALADKVGELLPNPVVVIDFHANLVVAGRSPSEAHFDGASWQQAVGGVLNRQIFKVARGASEARQNETLFVDDGKHRLKLSVRIEPLTIDDEVVGALMIFPTPQQSGQLDQMLLDSAKFALSVQMMRSFVRFRFETRSLTELFLEVVERRWRDEADIVNRARRLGVNLTTPQRLIVVDYADEAKDGGGGLADPHHALVRLLEQAGLGGTVIAVEDGLVCLVEEDAGRDTRLGKLPNKIAGELGRYFEREPAVLVSETCAALADYPTAWERCRRMIRIGRSFGRTGVFTGQDFGPLPMLVAAADVPDVRNFVDKSVGALIAHDREHGTPYLDTLFAYLREGCRSQACADAIGLHVTTLRYRLSRMEELFGIKLDTPEQRFAVELAIRLSGIIDSRVPAAR